MNRTAPGLLVLLLSGCAATPSFPQLMADVRAGLTHAVGGGRLGRLDFDPATRSIAVTDVPDVHRRIENLLARAKGTGALPPEHVCPCDHNRILGTHHRCECMEQPPGFVRIVCYAADGRHGWRDFKLPHCPPCACVTGKRISLNVREMRADAAVDEVARLAGLRIERVVMVERVTLDVRDVDVAVALETIVKTAGHHAVVCDGAGTLRIVRADSFRRGMETKLYRLT